MSMTEFHRKILEKVAPDFINDLDSEDIVPYLVADEAISRHDREKIHIKGTRREKVAALLDILPRRGDGAYISLLSSLTKTDGSKHLYEIMKKHEQWVSDQLQQELKEEKPPIQAISRHDREKIYIKETKREKVAAFFDILPRRGDGAYISFLRSLTKTDGSKHLYEIMKKHGPWLSDQLQQELKEEKPPIQGIIMVDKDALFDELSENFPATKYTTFCNKMGVGYNQAKSMLMRCKEDYNVALRDLLSQWDLKMKGVTRKQLEDALYGAEVGALCSIVEKHYEKASTEVAATGVVAGDGAVHNTGNWVNNQSHRSDSVHTHKEEISMVDKDALFDKLSEIFPMGVYTAFCIAMGFGYDEAMSMLKGCEEDYILALRDLLSQWDLKMKGITRKQLEDVLDRAEVDALCSFVEKHYEKEVILSKPGNQSSREMTAHTGPSTSALAGIPPQDASTDGAASSSSKASKHVDPGISEMELYDLAEKLGNHSNLVELALKLDFPYERWQRYKASNTRRDGRICNEGTFKMLYDWKEKTSQVSQKVLLNEALKYAGFAEFADDTDNNEGNGDQLTSFKHDSGSSQDDISFGGLSAPPEILARGPRAQRAYAEAAKAGTKEVYRTRLMLVGQERVGKTSLKKTLTGQGFDKYEAITDGVETANACEISREDAKTGEKVWSIPPKIKPEDKKHDEYSKALADDIAKRMKMTPPQDQESLGLNPKEAGDETAKRQTMTPPQDQESLGTHSCSSLGRDLNPDTAEEFVSDNVEAPNAKEEDGRIPNHLASLVEKKLKEQEMGTDSRGKPVSLSIWDFAGHDIYYTTHQVFLTWRAIYVIVFDLSRSLDSDVPLVSRDEDCEMSEGDAKSKLTCLEFINFWLCSIYAHAVAPSSKKYQNSPPIFIVGTHRESVKGDAKEKKKKIDSAFKEIRESIKKKPFQRHVVTTYYAIENSLEDKDEEIGKLREHIVEEAMKEPYMGEEIPISWLKFEEALAADKNNYLSLDETKVLTQPMGIDSEIKLLQMLTFYHDLGYVVYYGGIEDKQSLLRDMVILNPQWLIDVFKQVITIPNDAEMDRKVSGAWSTLEEDGILEDELIEHMWEDKQEPKEILVKLMDKFDLICDAPVKVNLQLYGAPTWASGFILSKV